MGCGKPVDKCENGWLDDCFISGFISANGRFYCYQKVKLMATGEEYNVSNWKFSVRGEREDMEVLEGIKNELGCGEIKKFDGSYYLIIRSHRLCLSHVIPFIERIGLKGHKLRKYMDWSEKLFNHYHKKGGIVK